MKINHETNFLFSMLIRSIYLSFAIILASYAGAVNRNSMFWLGYLCGRFWRLFSGVAIVFIILFLILICA